MIVSPTLDPDSTQEHEWLPLTEAAKRIGVSHAKLSRWAKQGRIRSQKNPFDERETLVDMIELRKIFRLP